MKKQLYEYLEQFMIESIDGSPEGYYEFQYTVEQARAIFTTLCLIGHIDADTAECDNILYALYEKCTLAEVIEYDNFKDYMIGLIV